MEEQHPTTKKKQQSLDPAATDSDSAGTDGDGQCGWEQEHWSAEEIELVYQRAMQALDHVELQAEDLQMEFGQFHHPDEAATESTQTATEPVEAESISNDEMYSVSQQPRITPRQIIEAALFVGGMSLTMKKLCSLLRDDFTEDSIEQTIQELNALYTRQNRPYEIQFGEGGYRLVLRSELGRISEQVFGLGPKEVKLSQEALEMLALVAYKQPITVEEIEALGKQKPNSLLRQLVRRELVSLHRDESDRSHVTYSTTDRFLEVFGLSNLDELPQTDDLSFK